MSPPRAADTEVKTMSFQTIVTPEMTELAEICRENTGIPRELYAEYDIKKGLRDVNGTGVRAGLTNISNIVSFKNVDGKRVPCPGELYYRGMNINDLTQGLPAEIEARRKQYEFYRDRLLDFQRKE